MYMPEDDLNRYLPLYKAAIKGEWDSARQFFDSNPDAVAARITKNAETLLHLAVGRSEGISFVEMLLKMMPDDALASKNKFNETALHYAARYGNIEAAKHLVDRHPGLPQIWNDTNLMPLHLAALFGHRQMVQYLLTVTRDDVEPNPYVDQSGITLLISIVHSGFYDVALDLVKKYPKLAATVSPGGNTALSILAGKSSAFLSGCSLSSWDKFIYFCIPINVVKISHPMCGCDVENLSEQQMNPTNKRWQIPLLAVGRNYVIFVCQKLYTGFWNVIGRTVEQVKYIHDAKVMHCQALELVKCLCLETINAGTSTTSASVFKPAAILAATHGHHEVMEEILRSFPSAIWCLDQEQHDLFQIAVINRRETIFNLLYDLDEHAHLVVQNTDRGNNNILHLAGKLAPLDRLNLVPGAASKMQRELQWYKEVGKFVTPSYKGKENSDGKTPGMVFTEEHKDLILESEQWLKDTAKSCTFAATLIGTVAFAAAVTVPGGNNTRTGIPILHKETTFMVFAVSNGLSLFSSMTCLLMFLFILNSRCSEVDFLFSLPAKLIIGVVNLLLSLGFMMVAFCSAVYSVFGHENEWILAPLVLLASIPLTLFLLVQYPLLRDMIRLTYGPSIFCKKRKSIFSEPD